MFYDTENVFIAYFLKTFFYSEFNNNLIFIKFKKLKVFALLNFIASKFIFIGKFFYK